MIGRPRAPEFHWGLIVPVVGATVGAVAVGILACAIYGLAIGDDAAASLLLATAGLVALAVVAFAGGRRLPHRPLRSRDPFLAVTLAWVAAAAAGAVPYLIEGTFTRFADAMFESMSGFTTTGATLIDDVDGQPDALLLWRSLSQWLGGLGIVVLVVAIAPAAGLAMQRVFQAETSGITPDRLTPRIAETAKILWSIYLVFTAAGFVAFALAGMGSFDAINHVFTAIASGGFSTRTASIAAFDSVAVELVAIVLMTLTSVNYAFYWRIVRGRPLLPQAAEVRAFLLILAGAILAVTASLIAADHAGGGGQALRDAAFTVTSVISTTGFTTADFDTWNDTARMTILLVMLVGGCAGSTAGGIKVVRVLLVARSAAQELGRQLRPRAVQVLRLGGHVYTEEMRRAVLAFFLTFVAVVVGSTFVLLAAGMDLLSAMSAVVATITLVGPGLGEVGASENFQAVPELGRVVCTFLMLVGRLELFTVLVLLTPVFWRRTVA